MKIFADDGKEFASEKEAREYEERIKNSRSIVMKKANDLLKSYNQLVSDMKKDGYTLEIVYINGEYTPRCTRKREYNYDVDFNSFWEEFLR